MKYFIALAALAVSALAAPQVAPVAYRPAAYQPYQPLAYPVPVAAKAAYKPIVPAYKTYSAPVPTYVAPVPAYKPVAYSAPAYPTPQSAYIPQPQYATAPGYIKPIAIVRQSQDDNFDGSFTYDFETENGIANSASGYIKNAGSEAEAQVIQGQYSYTAPDGTPVVTRWFADDTGFHAEGSHIPTPGAEPYRTA